MKKYDSKTGDQRTQTLLRGGTQEEDKYNDYGNGGRKPRQQSDGDELDEKRVDRTDGEISGSEYHERSDTGKVTSELISECLEEIAENEELIMKLQAKTLRLKNKVSRLQEVTEKLQNSDTDN